MSLPAARREPGRAEPPPDELERRRIAPAAVDDRRADGSSADRINEADGGAADRDCPDRQSADRDADSDGGAPQGQEQSERRAPNGHKAARQPPDRDPPYRAMLPIATTPLAILGRSVLGSIPMHT